jgi:flavin-dependent dehydrogenase
MALDQATRKLWDALVVGAGPAGTMAACQIARQGKSVLLIDKSAFPREKVCGGSVSFAALQTLAASGVGLPPEIPSVQLKSMCLAAGGYLANLPLPLGQTISRSDLDAQLVKAAIAAGAAFLPETSARSAADGPEFRTVGASNRANRAELRAKVLLIAQGLHGQLLRSDPSLHVRPDARIGVATTLAGQHGGYEREIVYMACGADGYVGLVRFADGSLHIAAALDPVATRREGIGVAAQRIIRRAGLVPPSDLENAAWQGTALLTRTRGQIAAHRLLVLGDAAGYVEPFTGEGIAWALASGRAVAPLAAMGIDGWSQRLIGQWTAIQHRLVRRRQLICRILAQALRHPSLMGAAVAALSWLPGLSMPVTRMINQPYSPGQVPERFLR